MSRVIGWLKLNDVRYSLSVYQPAKIYPSFSGSAGRSAVSPLFTYSVSVSPSTLYVTPYTAVLSKTYSVPPYVRRISPPSYVTPLTLPLDGTRLMVSPS